MSKTLSRLRGLIGKLALFYVLISLPILVLVESTVLYFEYYHLVSEVNDGALNRALDNAATDIGTGLSPRQFSEAPWIAWLDAWLIRMQWPREAFSGDAAYILSELSREPLAAAFYAGDGELVAQAPPYRQTELNLPSTVDLARAADAPASITLNGADSPLYLRRALSPIRDENRQFVGWLYLEMRVPHPWRKIIGDITFEWPIILIFLILFGLASSAFLTAYVTRRLDRFTRAAAAWSQGDFSRGIDDPSRDELGTLSHSLNRMADQLRELMHSRAQLATLEERQRLARDLHDTVKQKAFALNLQLATIQQHLKNTSHRDEMATAQQLCRQIQVELSTLLEELRNTEQSFHQRLQRRVHNWSSYSGIAADIHSEPLPPVSSDIADQLLRICDEALSNILRHSQARQVRIHLQMAGDRLKLSIQDDGHGIIPPQVAGMGLKNMRERAQQLPAGTCHIEGTPRQGTRVAVECQIQ